MTDWVPPPELEIQNYSHVGDQELQHWINQVRFNAEKSIMAEKQAIMAAHVADLTANRAIAAAAQFYKWNANQQMLLQPPAPTVGAPTHPLAGASDMISSPIPQAFPTSQPQTSPTLHPQASSALHPQMSPTLHPQVFSTLHTHSVPPSPPIANATPGDASAIGTHTSTQASGAQNTLLASLGNTAAVTRRLMPLEGTYIFRGEIAKGCEETFRKPTQVENSVRARAFLAGVPSNVVPQ